MLILFKDGPLQSPKPRFFRGLPSPSIVVADFNVSANEFVGHTYANTWESVNGAYIFIYRPTTSPVTSE